MVKATILTRDGEIARHYGDDARITFVLMSPDPDTQKLVFTTCDGQSLRPEQVALDADAYLRPTQENDTAHQDIVALWEEMFGLALPPCLPQADMPDIAALRDRVLDVVLEQNAAASRVSARHMRELGLLRQQHDLIQASFRGLEHFVYGLNVQHRTPGPIIAPTRGQPVVTLQNGMQVQQRVASASPGLCDLALWFDPEGAAPKGMVSVTLTGLDSDQVLAVWDLQAAQLSTGWNRFSLERALGPDPVSLQITVHWVGGGVLTLACATDHPDPRFRPKIGDDARPAVLAQRVWSWVPGVAAPLLTGAHLPNGYAGKGQLRHVGREWLEQALDMRSLRADIPFIQGTDALLVHVLEQDIAAAIVPDLVFPGAVEISAGICTYHKDGPEVEYAMLALPKSERPTAPGILPQALHTRLTADAAETLNWVRVAPDTASQCRLYLDPSEQRQDLYLLTRLADKDGTNAFGWSGFSDLKLRFGAQA
ncbi:hypothetical protein BFP70_05015 [Thioclava sp. SK-1]|uniref:DUF6212 domain-containing protein n=1 Tax=Thioclava sp. SK-1 TaxID=1889770 RepID=UPI000825903C|nr:DUF6212 domain-containing protein [Thioclava sp. SK-1]OCX66388.1 hypothetical protein BFP70_05015 [Thioclava sp. SK-1]